jgi:hypothetical protein
MITNDGTNISSLKPRRVAVAGIIVIIIIAFYFFMKIDPGCGDCFAQSPEELLRDFDYVLTGVCVKIDTLEVVGSYKDDDGKIYDMSVVECVIRPDHILKGAKKPDSIFIWAVEKGGWSTRRDVMVGSKKYLLYGVELSIPDKVDRLFDAHRLGTTGIPDSLAQSNFLNSRALELCLNSRKKSEVVICGTDNGTYASYLFSSGTLCYSTMEGKSHAVSSDEYLAELIKLSDAK